MRKFLGVVIVVTIAFSIYVRVIAQTTGVLVSHTELEASQLSTVGGQCNPGVETTRVVFYCNESARYHTASFSNGAGRYRVDIRAASSNTSQAGITGQIDGRSIGTVYWPDTVFVTKSLTVDISSGTTHEVKFILTTDVGQSDTIVDWYELYYLGASPTSVPIPTPPSTGAAVTGTYRNLFAEAGYSSAEIAAKLTSTWNSLFYGDANNAAVYRAVGGDMAYIEDVNNHDIRSEGQSYGMMIALQMNKKAEFDRLWKFARTYMKCPRSSQCQIGSGKEGYFSWQLRASDFSAMDENPAPDGEEYFTTALLFAASRWGNAGSFNYQQDAQDILNAMVNDTRPNSVHSMFNLQNNIVVFSPMNASALYTDPSYHLPAFYEVWARVDSNAANRTFWTKAAGASRAFWKNASGSNAGRTNGLMPDCALFNGTATYGCAGGAIYSYDSWRTIANVAVDYAWWAADPWEKTEADRFQNFFGAKRPSYPNQWNLDGTPAGGTTNSTGQIAMNAVAGLAGSTTNVVDFVNDVWNLQIPTGQYRYYDGMLYTMSLLHLSGNFRAYLPDSTFPTSTLSPIVNTPTPTITVVTPSVPPPNCKWYLGDINCDGRISLMDFEIWRQNFFLNI